MVTNKDALDALLEASGVPKDTFTISVDIHLDWKDRLRVLFGRVIHVRTRQRVWVVSQGPKQGLAHDQATTTIEVDPLVLGVDRRRPTDIGGYGGVQEIGQ